MLGDVGAISRWNSCLRQRSFLARGIKRKVSEHAELTRLVGMNETETDSKNGSFETVRTRDAR